MSRDKLRRQGELWLFQANDDAESAALLLAAGKFATAGFLFQQAAEKAVKAFAFAIDADPWGHSISKLISELPENAGVDLGAELTAARRLDKLYIPTRYPDALPDLAPAQAYTREEAEQARSDCTRILDRVRAWFERD